MQRLGISQRLLLQPLLKPRYQLFQIDAIEADLAPVAPRLVEVEQVVQLLRIIAIKILGERLGNAVVPAFRKLRLDLRIVFLGIVDFVADDGLLATLAFPIDNLKLLPAELKGLHLGRDAGPVGKGRK